MWLDHRFALSFRDVEDLLAERAVGSIGLAMSGTGMRSSSRSTGNAAISGAVDQDGDVLEVLARRHRDTSAAMRFFRKLLEGRGGLRLQRVTDKLRSCPCAFRQLGLPAPNRAGQYKNNRADGIPADTTERERPTPRFKPEAEVRRVLGVHAAIQSSFRVARHRLKAIHHRVRRERDFNSWKLGTCVRCEKMRATTVGSRFHRRKLLGNALRQALLAWTLASALCASVGQSQFPPRNDRVDTDQSAREERERRQWVEVMRSVRSRRAHARLGSAASSFEARAICPVLAGPYEIPFSSPKGVSTRKSCYDRPLERAPA